MNKLDKIVKVISLHNNNYRAPNVTPLEKLEYLWDIGAQLKKLGVSKPHSIGWKIQDYTKGVIKRPTIFRSMKVRDIWLCRDDIKKDLYGLKNITYFVDMLPIIDPSQKVRKQISNEEISELYRKACSHDVQQFKEYVKAVKAKYSYGRLGQKLDKTKHLSEIEFIHDNFKKLYTILLVVFKDENEVNRQQIRNKISNAERLSFSNMCIALTTKANVKLYKKMKPFESLSAVNEFKVLYDHFHYVLQKKDDIERARVRRLISADAFSDMSDIMSSLLDEESVKDYKYRKGLSIGL